MVPTVPFADISFGDLLLLIAEFFLLVIWIWILFTIITDLFRDHELSGWWKAVWIVFLIFIPFLAAFVYLVARGSGMRDRTIKAQAEAKKHLDEYVRSAAAPSPADELAKLHDLRVKGVLSEAEYEGAKAKLL
jgi:Short C-terminal domain/Phospholipase_D-nuclease N-terminal